MSVGGGGLVAGRGELVVGPAAAKVKRKSKKLNKINKNKINK
jgi:hypothetical protein